MKKTYKEASITNNNVTDTLTHKSELHRKMVIFVEVVTVILHYLAPPTMGGE